MFGSYAPATAPGTVETGTAPAITPLTRAQVDAITTAATARLGTYGRYSTQDVYAVLEQALPGSDIPTPDRLADEAAVAYATAKAAEHGFGPNTPQFAALKEAYLAGSARS